MVLCAKLNCWLTPKLRCWPTVAAAGLMAFLAAQTAPPDKPKSSVSMAGVNLFPGKRVSGSKRANESGLNHPGVAVGKLLSAKPDWTSVSPHVTTSLTLVFCERNRLAQALGFHSRRAVRGQCPLDAGRAIGLV